MRYTHHVWRVVHCFCDLQKQVRVALNAPQKLSQTLRGYKRRQPALFATQRTPGAS